MEEIKIWAVDDGGAVPVQPTSGMASELLLEDTLVNNPDLLMPGIRLVGRQTPTEGGPLDLLGVDEDGRLVVFELKRGTLSRDAVAQVIDYASDLDLLDNNALASFIARNSGKHGIDQIDDFQDWYAQNTEADGFEALRPIRTVLVGLGVDERTERMVRFLANNSQLDISLLTFHGFSYEGRTLLARQMQVEGNTNGGENAGSGKRLSRAERWSGLQNRAVEYGVDELFNEVLDVVRRNWNRPDESPMKIGISLRLWSYSESGRRRYHSYAWRVDTYEHRVDLVFHARAIALCPDKFWETVEDIPFDTYPSGRLSNPFESGTEIQFRLNKANWETHKAALAELARSVYQALQERNQGRTPSEADFEEEDDSE